MAALRTRTLPQRSCIGCRERRGKRALIRLARGADGSVRVDERGREPGRGGYLCESPACWERALEGGRLARALRAPVREEDRAMLRAWAGRRLGRTGESGRDGRAGE